MYKLSNVHKCQLKSMDNNKLLIVKRLFTRMASHPLQVTDEPLRNQAIADYASKILKKRIVL